MNRNLDEDGVRGLCAAVLLEAVNDWRKTANLPEFYVPGKDYSDAFFVNRSELRVFFGSAWFEILCETLQLNPHKVVTKLNVTHQVPYWREKRNARRRERRKAQRAATASERTKTLLHER